MRKTCARGALGLLAFAAGAVQAQQPTPVANESAPAEVQTPVAPCAASGSQAAAEPAQQPQRKKKKGGLARDVSRATGASAGQVAGAAVAGPVGAAAVGVVGEKVGDAIGSIVKGGKKDRDQTAQGEGQVSECVSRQQAAQPGS